jgi:C-terminal peptidase prc
MLWLVAGLALLLASTVFLIYSVIRQQRPTPLQVYGYIWEAVRNYALYPELIGTWEQWRAHGGEIATAADAVRLANEMLKPLNDPYTMALTADQQQLFSRWETTEAIGVGVRIAAGYENTDAESCSQKREVTGVSCQFPTIVSVINNSPAAAAGIVAGDVIVAIDDWSTSGRPLAEILSRMHGKNRASITLSIERDGKKREVSLKRAFVTMPTAWSRMLAHDVGYLRISNFGSWVYHYATKEAGRLKKARAVVLDLRDNPGGDINTALRLCAMFSRHAVLTRMESRLIGGEGCTTKTVRLEPLAGMVEVLDTGSYPQDHIELPSCWFDGKPLVVLVNENTASAAELFAGAMRDGVGATVLGARTFGKGVFQHTINLPHCGVSIRVTSGKFFCPNGDWAGDGARDKRGIEPSVSVPTQSKLFDIGWDSDLQLQAAVHLLEQKLNDGR